MQRALSRFLACQVITLLLKTAHCHWCAHLQDIMSGLICSIAACINNVIRTVNWPISTMNCHLQDKYNGLSFTMERPRTCPIPFLCWPFNCTILCPLKLFVRSTDGALLFLRPYALFIHAHLLFANNTPDDYLVHFALHVLPCCALLRHHCFWCIACLVVLCLYTRSCCGHAIHGRLLLSRFPVLGLSPLLLPAVSAIVCCPHHCWAYTTGYARLYSCVTSLATC